MCAVTLTITAITHILLYSTLPFQFELEGWLQLALVVVGPWVGLFLVAAISFGLGTVIHTRYYHFIHYLCMLSILAPYGYESV